MIKTMYQMDMKMNNVKCVKIESKIVSYMCI
jgi:hypothetical protein